MKDALDEALILSAKYVLTYIRIRLVFSPHCRVIQDLVTDVLADAGAMYKASEAVAFNSRRIEILRFLLTLTSRAL
jgi:hypothetical protein